MYHVELRQFPHNCCRFNLTAQELRETILDAWARNDWIEFGERKWSPHQANLTVLEGPQIPVAQLSMGRGWRNAQRQGQDVTERLLAAVRAAAGAHADARAEATATANATGVVERQSAMERDLTSDTQAGAGPGLDMRLAADSLGLEVLAKLGGEPVPLATAWGLARERYPERPASDCLKLAEHAIRSLAERRLAVVLSASGRGEPEPCRSPEQVEQALRAIDSWSSGVDSPPVLIRGA